MTLPQQRVAPSLSIADLRRKMLRSLARFERAKAAADRMEDQVLERLNGRGTTAVGGTRLPASYHVLRELDGNHEYEGLVADYRSHQRRTMMYAAVLVALSVSGEAP